MRGSPGFDFPRLRLSPAILTATGIVALVILSAEAAAIGVSNSTSSSGLADAETWTKIVGGILGAVIAFIGMPTALLQFSKTRAEIKKLRLEATKLSSEVSDQYNEEFENQALRVIVDNSPYSVVSIETAAGLSGPMLVVVDFVVSFILFEGFRLLLRLNPFGGVFWNLLTTSALVVAFLVLFVPVYLNARQARLLLREVAEARRTMLGRNLPEPSVASDTAPAEPPLQNDQAGNRN